MAPKVDQGTIIILDIGRNVSDPEDKNGKSFFEEARECTSRIIERKIMSQGKNLLGVILLGAKKTKNNMAEQCPGSFRHIETLAELQTPTWQMIRNLPEQPSNSRGDWLDALVVAADHFKNGVSGVKIASKKIILVTNFQPPSKFDSNDVEQILDGFKEEEFEVDVFGPDIYDEKQNTEDIELAKQFIEITNGTTAPFEDTMRYLLFHRKKVTRPTPWNIDLSIGPNVKIPVSAYIKLRDEPVVKSWLKAVKDPVTSTASTTEGIMKNTVHINVENQSVVENTDIIEGYQYGQRVVPFTENDKSMLYHSGERCLSVYGFTHASKITWQSLNGDGLFYIFGRKGNKNSYKTIRCLVECLQELNLVGIVRRVYNNGNAPKMFALMPVIDTNNFICLSMVGICFNEEIKRMTFPPTSLKKYACTDDQVNGFKNLIKAMDLTKAYDETFDDAEAFPVAETVSPSVQYVLDCIAFRAMNPDKPLPQPRDDIMTLFKQPAPIEVRAREPLEKLNNLFVLNKVEEKPKRKYNQAHMDIDDVPLKQSDGSPNTSNQANDFQDLPKVQMPIKKLDEVTRIGTIEPVSDYKILKDKGKTVADLSHDITEVIENLFYCNLDGTYAKALDTMKFFRTECVLGEPSYYNDWLQKFRVALNDRKKSNILSLILESQLGFILKEENNSSTFDAENSHEDSQMYENDTIPNSTELTIRSEVNDMFDEM